MINSYNLYVDFINGVIEPDRPIKIVRNDSDSILLKFKIKNAEAERKVIKLLFPNGTGCIRELVNDELILKSDMLKFKGTIRFELSLYNNEQRLTNFALGSMIIRDELLDEDTMIQEDDRLPILTTLINEVKNFNINDVDGGNADTKYSINGGGA
ncbi:MAG: hypothetical protein J5982_03275 [Bacilli bacterium]|nr:hypothetical protein [Bacilli bacterium]